MAGATWAAALAAALALALAAAGGVAAGGGDGFIRKYAMMKLPGARSGAAGATGAAGGVPRNRDAAPAPRRVSNAPRAASSFTSSKRRKRPPVSVPFDSVKLQEAIMGFRQTASPPGGAVYPGAAPPAGYYPAPQAQPFGYYPGGYYPQAYPSAAAAYPGGYPAAAPVYPQPAPYYPAAYPGGYSAGGYYPVPTTSGHRGSLDDALEPNYAGIQEKLRALPVGEELRRDLLAGDVREGYDRDEAELRSAAAAADPQDLQDVARDMFDFLSGAGLAEESIY
ncbi:Protein of unknown function [Gryllus bimaculatus]|nr:Protein of unknown function [Gryllus bimaculatus]